MTGLFGRMSAHLRINQRIQTKRPRLTLTTLGERVMPSGVPTSWSIHGSGGGGALFSPQINPSNPSELFISSDMSELFHSTDSGATWQPIPFLQIQGNHETKVQYTERPNLVYTLDYSTIAGNDLIRPSRSIDGGLTWTPLASDPTDGGAFYYFVDPANHNRQLLTDYQRLYVSLDDGTTWSLEYTSTDPNAGLMVGGVFFDGNSIYLGTNSGLITSSNGGSSFSLSNLSGIPAGKVIRSLAGAKQNGIVRLVAVIDDAGDTYASVQGYDNNGGTGVYTLDIGSNAWVPRSLGSNSAWPFFASMAMTDVNTMYVAGGSDTGTPTVYKSVNGGANWTAVLRTAGNANIQTGWSGSGGDRDWGYGETAMGFVVDAADPNRLIITDYGFAHQSTDGGSSWQVLNVSPADRNPTGSNTPKGLSYHDSGLDNTTAWGVTWADANNIILSNSDIRGQRSTDGGATFGFNYTGHTLNSMYRVVSYPNGKLYAATGSQHDLYQSTTLTDARIDGATGQVLFSSDKGASWQLIHNFNHEVAWVAADPSNSERLYASVSHSTLGGIYVTNNLSAGASSTWTRLASPPRTEGHAFNVTVLNDGTIVASYSGRRNASGAFTASSGLFVSTNGGQSWLDRSDAGMKYWTKDVVVDPHDPTQSTWLVCVFSGWGGAPNGLGGLYRTTDRGLTWTKMLGNLDRVTSATFNPSDANELFVTTETEGLWYSSNIHSTTPTFIQVSSYGFRQPERVFFNPFNANEIWVTSFGAGVMVGTTSSPPPPTVPPPPPPSAGTIQFNSPTYSVGEAGSVIMLTATRSGGSFGSITAQYATFNGTALSGSDFTAISGSLFWADGETTPKTVTITILDDTIVETLESFSVQLTSTQIGSSAMTVVTITDNDVSPPPPAGTIQFNSPTYAIGEAGGAITLTATRSGGSFGPITVQYATSNGIAVSVMDFLATSGTLSWADGDATPRTVSITIVNDTIVESSESFSVLLTSAQVGSPATAVVTITDNDLLSPSPPPPPPPSSSGQPFVVGADAGMTSAVKMFNADGSTQISVVPFGSTWTGGVRTAAADFNGDGIADLVVGTGPGGPTHVKIFDGVTQAELFSIDPFEAAFTGGVFVAAGDINGDGKADLAITPDEGGGPRARVFSGNGFTQIADFFGIDDPNFRGGARAAIGDMNGDGKGDLVVVAGFGGGPRVAAFDGAQLGSNGGPKLFGDFFALEQGLRNGIFVAAGDVNGDGFADLVGGGGPGGGPRVYILDGKSLVQNGSNSLVPVGNYFAGDVNSRGGVRVAIKDLDGDNKADVITGSGTNAGSRVTAYLGRDTTPLGGTPPTALDFDAFAGFSGGVFVG